MSERPIASRLRHDCVTIAIGSQDLDEEEASEAAADYEALQPSETRWLRHGHPYVGKSLVCARLSSDVWGSTAP